MASRLLAVCALLLVGSGHSSVVPAPGNLPHGADPTADVHGEAMPGAPTVSPTIIDRHVLTSPFFYFMENDLRCFYEELNPSTHVAVHYTCPHLDHELRAKDLGVSTHMLDPIGIEVFVNGPDGYPVWLPQNHQVLSSPEDSFAFDSQQAGEYEICLRTNVTHFHENEKLKFYVQIVVGADAMDWKAVAAKDHLDGLHLQVRELKAKIKEINTDQLLLKLRERRFRETSESTFTRVWMVAVVQVGILCATALWQMTSFKKFLIAKKLV